MTTFDTRLTNLPASLWQRIAQIDELKGEWRASAGLGPQALGRLKRSVLVTSTGGYYKVLQFVFDSWHSIELTENTIKELHGQLLAHATKDARHRGQYKTMDNAVKATDPQGQVLSVLFDTTPPYLTAKQMGELVDWTNQALEADEHHQLLVIANFVVEFLKIYPFLDGNGRLSRILTNLLMLRAGYGFVPYVSHEHLIEAHKADYYLALRRSQVTFRTPEETIQPWLEFFLDVCRSQARQATDLLSDAAIERLFSPAQRKIWNYLLTVDEAAPREIVAATGMPLPTVASALGRLLGLAKVERLGLGSATRYRRVTAGELRRAG